jgi:hypothetical protein
MVAAYAQAASGASQPASGVSEPPSASVSCPNGTSACGGASLQLLSPVQDATTHHSMAMTALGVSLVILVAAVYAIIMMKRWS